MVYKRNQVKKKNRQNINIQGTVLENENNLNDYKILKRIQFCLKHKRALRARSGAAETKH